jgi:hypothetical protein
MRLAAFGIAACDRATSRYPWDRIASETLAVYERTIEQTSAPRAASAGPAATAPAPSVSRLVTKPATAEHRTERRAA